MKKNILAAALVAGLGMAGAAAAYNYGTSPDLPTPEDVAYQQLFSASYTYTMTEGLVFDIETPDNAANIGDSFTVRIALNSRCNPHDAMTNPTSPPSNTPVCAPTTDGALFDTTNIPAPGDMVLDPALTGTWTVAFDGYTNGGTTANFRITPLTANPVNPSAGTLLTWNNARLTSLNEFAAGDTSKVDAEFWMVNIGNDARFVNSTMSRTILNRVTGVTACANRDGAETDKYIDVADSWLSEIMPKSRFSWDGKLGSATSDTGYNSQWIDLGDVTITNNGAGSFAFLGSDQFHTEIAGGASDNWEAFDNGDPAVYNDDVFLKDGTCASGTIVAQGEVNGNVVFFDYDGSDAGLPLTTGPSTTSLTVCGFVDSDTVIDDHNNVVTTTFFRAGNAVPTPTFGLDGSCTLLPLRYNGSTMEIFTINPGSNTTQRSFVRLTNRSATDGYVSLVGIDNAGVEGASQVRVWVPAGASVQLDSADLENGTNGAIGAWGAPTDGKWRAVVTAEFPGLVASSLVNSSLPRVLTNITDSDTRGEQYMRDGIEGTLASLPGLRPSDVEQESTPDFRGNGESTEQPGGPNGSDGPAGGTTDPCGNEGIGSGLDHGTSTDSNDNSNEDPYCYTAP
jgi:hypothetical protein